MAIHFGFSVEGLIVFLLPMIINIFYAIFPVLYFIAASIWLHNYIATVIMIIFGIAHNIVSYQKLHIKE